MAIDDVHTCRQIVLNISASQCLFYHFKPNLTDAAVPTQKPVSVEEVVHLYVLGVLCLVGLLGNVVTLAVMRYDRERREALILMQFLAAADTLYLLTALLRYPLKYLVTDKFDYVRLQPYVFPTLKLCQTLTIWLMVIVTVDRYVFVSKPMQASVILQDKGRMRRAVGVTVFAAGALYNLPRFFDSCVTIFVNPCNGGSVSIIGYRTIFNNSYYFDIYINAAYIIFLYVIPLVVLSVLNILLIRVIRMPTSRRREISRASRESSENNATLVLIVIVLLFIVCESPELVCKLIILIDRHIADRQLFSRTLVKFTMVPEILMVVNSSTNFFVYFCFGKRFRQKLREMFTRKKKTRTCYTQIVAMNMSIIKGTRNQTQSVQRGSGVSATDVMV